MKIRRRQAWSYDKINAAFIEAKVRTERMVAEAEAAIVQREVERDLSLKIIDTAFDLYEIVFKLQTENGQLNIDLALAKAEIARLKWEMARL